MSPHPTLHDGTCSSDVDVHKLRRRPSGVSHTQQQTRAVDVIGLECRRVQGQVDRRQPRPHLITAPIADYTKHMSSGLRTETDVKQTIPVAIDGLTTAAVVGAAAAAGSEQYNTQRAVRELEKEIDKK